MIIRVGVWSREKGSKKRIENELALLKNAILLRKNVYADKKNE